jgi:hypothetical protein
MARNGNGYLCDHIKTETMALATQNESHHYGDYTIRTQSHQKSFWKYWKLVLGFPIWVGSFEMTEIALETETGTSIIIKQRESQ